MFERPFSFIVAKLLETMLQVNVMIICVGKILFIQFPAVKKLAKKIIPYALKFLNRFGVENVVWYYRHEAASITIHVHIFY